MSVVNVFRGYIEEHHPHLIKKDWKIDIRVLAIKEIQHKAIQATIPKEIRGELTCWIFYYEEDRSNWVYLLQDKERVQNIGIGLLEKEEVVRPICLL